MSSEQLKKEAITEFRKLWVSINKENQHLTTEKIEDLIVSLLAKQQEEFVKMIDEMQKECWSNYEDIRKDNVFADIKNKLKI
jgi:predicted DsbA family dithiol-disulfide isomerase